MSLANTLDQMDLCRICLVTEQVDIRIFEVETEEDEIPQLLTKINICLPIKVAKDDKLPQKICIDCLCKLESFYQFYNISAQAEQQLLTWLTEEKPTESQVLMDDNRSKDIDQEFIAEDCIDVKPCLPEDIEQDDHDFFDDR